MASREKFEPKIASWCGRQGLAVAVHSANAEIETGHSCTCLEDIFSQTGNPSGQAKATPSADSCVGQDPRQKPRVASRPPVTPPPYPAPESTPPLREPRTVRAED
ncbi:unnamed protein product, partial [Ectocarpus sp. 12 AP-2014]